MAHGTVPGDHHCDEPQLNGGESLTDAFERLRRRARELRADQRRIQGRPFLSCQAPGARARLRRLSIQGAPSVARLVELNGPVDFQTRRLTRRFMRRSARWRSPKCLTRSH